MACSSCRSTEPTTKRSASARFNVSLTDCAKAAAPWTQHCSNARAICSGVINGRAASCTATYFASRSMRPKPARTESCRRSPPGTIARIFLNPAPEAIFLISSCHCSRATTTISLIEVARSNARVAWEITGSSAITANNLSNPMRWLLPPATMMAESMADVLNRESSHRHGDGLPSGHLTTRGRVGSSETDSRVSILDSLIQLSCHFRAKRFTIGATACLRLQRFHHRAHLRFGCGAELSNGFAHDFRQFVRAHPLWQVSVQNRQLFFFLVSQFRAAAFFKTFDGTLSLLRLLANDLNGLSVTEFGLRVGFCDRRVFQCRFKHAQHAQFRCVFGAHRLLQIRVHTFLQRHRGTITTPERNCRCCSRRPVGDDSNHTELTVRTAKRLQRFAALANRFGVANGHNVDVTVRAFQ